MDEEKQFTYVLSCDLDLNVRVKICSLEGALLRNLSYKSLLEDPYLQYSGLYGSKTADLYVTCHVFGEDGRPLFIPMKTSYRPFKNKWNWNEWLVLPLKYKDLPRHAQIGFTIWDLHPPKTPVPIGGTTLDLFGKLGSLRKGRYKLHLWEGLPSCGGKSGCTPGKGRDAGEMDRLERLLKKFERGTIKKCEWLDKFTFREIEKINQSERTSSKKMLLFVEFPKFDHSVVFHERSATAGYSEHGRMFIKIPDPELFRDNLVEGKHRNLARSYRRGAHDKELKPNPAMRDNLKRILDYSPTKSLSSEEKDLIWKFRYFLSEKKKGLTKFLKCVEWNNVSEAKQATDLLGKWETIDIDDALELLSGAFPNESVRRYAVERLKKSDDDEILSYLLQLVQALKYDKYDSASTMTLSVSESLSDEDTMKQGSSLSDFLISRALANSKLCNFFYWYINVECQSPNEKVKRFYTSLHRNFIQALGRSPKGVELRDGLEAQSELIGILCSLASELKAKKLDREKKTLYLREMLKKHPVEITCPLPLEPLKTIVGVDYHNALVMKSSLMPMKLPFKTSDGMEYSALFKTGDDLRQDQLIIQIISLIDRLLQKENVDLKLTPYRVLATGTDSGLVEFIDARPVAHILQIYPSIQAFFKDCFPANLPPYGIQSDVMDNYIKSCAGYCVITYILGVGDRHLDNLLLSSSGRLSHIDFGYILGRDPKLFPPPMKISKEMVEAMGGTNSPEYSQFLKLGYTAFQILRQNANLILNLFSLMIDANIPDIALEGEGAVIKVQEKFALHLNDTEAEAFYRGLVEDSVNSLFSPIAEQMHKWAQYFRK